MNLARRTIANPITITGVGLFTATPATITIKPNHTFQHDSTGIIFAINNHHIPAHIDNLSNHPVHQAFANASPRCTSIGNQTKNIATIEHLMSALVGLGITDAIIETNAPEIPILDGSALPFIKQLTTTEIITLDTTIQPIGVHEKITVTHNDSSITIDPASTPSYTYTLDYGHDSPLQKITVSWNGHPDSYTKDIAPARTFCLEHEADAMHAAGLFTHLTTRDMLVIGHDGPIDNTLRHEHECARHKLLDLIGDLALVGRPLIAKVTAHKSGHALAHKAARAIVDQNT